MSETKGILQRGKARLQLLRDGFVYTADEAVSTNTSRHPAVLLLSLEGRRIHLKSACGGVEGQAVLVGPQVQRWIATDTGAFAAIQIEPSHSEFRRFVDQKNRAGIAAFSSESFEHLIAPLQRCYSGEATRENTEAIFNETIAVLCHLVGPARAKDERIAIVLDHLSRQSPVDYSFDEVLELVRMSSGRLSHLFTEEVGLSLRSFKMWRKIKEAIRLLATGINLTEIAHESGFSDSAHFSRSFHLSLGLVPSAFVAGRCVQVHDFVA